MIDAIFKVDKLVGFVAVLVFGDKIVRFVKQVPKMLAGVFGREMGTVGADAAIGLTHADTAIRF